MRLLVVEDESLVAKGLQHDLQTMGYQVPAIAASGEEALEKAAQTDPDLVLMDIVLKGNMDGIEVSRRMRAASSASMRGPVPATAVVTIVNSLSRGPAMKSWSWLC